MGQQIEHVVEDQVEVGGSQPEAIAAREKAKHDIDIELDKANEVLKDRIIGSVLTATEKLIGEKLDRDKHNKLINDFLDNVKVR